jgi:hypothetical protein
MAKGSYIGGGTIIRPEKQADWFGSGPVEDPDYRAALNKFEAAKAHYRKVEAERPTGKQRTSENAREHAKRLRAAFDAMEAAKPRPSVAQPRKALSPATEQRIGNLKRDLSMYAAQARKATASHEECRQELSKLLAEHGIAESRYPETRKLKL